MATEIEAKFRCREFEPFRVRLRELGAAPSGRVFETNTIFDTPEHRLLGTGCGLRIRVCRPLDAETLPEAALPALLTYKGPRAAGELKIREELETAVADPDTLGDVLKRLGFQEVIVYQKRRETWHLGPCEITLDELPRLGSWLEIEGPDAAAIDKARTLLDLSATAPASETYVSMAATHGTADANGCQRLLFEPTP